MERESGGVCSEVCVGSNNSAGRPEELSLLNHMIKNLGACVASEVFNFNIILFILIDEFG